VLFRQFPVVQVEELKVKDNTAPVTGELADLEYFLMAGFTREPLGLALWQRETHVNLLEDVGLPVEVTDLHSLLTIPLDRHKINPVDADTVDSILDHVHNFRRAEHAVSFYFHDEFHTCLS
jgi:hypothetical protein